jgi:hypothetical protein
MRYGLVEEIHLGHNKIQWRAVVYVVKDVRDSKREKLILPT